MNLRTCELCHVTEAGGHILVTMPTIIAGEVIQKHPVCVDKAGCKTRQRLIPSPSYSEAHRVVVAARKARLS